MQKFDFGVSSEAIRAMEQNINLSDFSLSDALSLFPVIVSKSDKHRIDVILTAGDSYTIPGNTPHSFEVLEDGEVVDVFTPHREDYL